MWRSLLVLVLCLFGAACAEPTSSPAWLPVDDPIGPAWERDGTPWRVAVADDEAGAYTRGVYLRRGDHLLAAWTERAWLGDEGWVPLLLALPRAGEEEPGSVDGEALVLALDGSEEHGCPAHALEVRVTIEDDAPVLDVHGVPYLALPAEGALEVDHAEGRWTAEASTLSEPHAFSGATTLAADALGAGALLTVEVALPWLQLEPWGGFVEVDFDHGCEADPPMRAPRLRLTPELL